MDTSKIESVAQAEGLAAAKAVDAAGASLVSRNKNWVARGIALLVVVVVVVGFFLLRS